MYCGIIVRRPNNFLEQIGIFKFPFNGNGLGELEYPIRGYSYPFKEQFANNTNIDSIIDKLPEIDAGKTV